MKRFGLDYEVGSFVKAIILALGVAGMIYFLFSIGALDKLRTVLPGFNDTKPTVSEVAIVGINLNLLRPNEESEYRRVNSFSQPFILNYFSGSDWQEAKGSPLRLGTKEIIDAQAFADEIVGFYFTGPRMPKKPFLPLSTQTSYLTPQKQGASVETGLIYLVEESYPGNPIAVFSGVYLNVVDGNLYDSPQANEVSSAYDVEIGKRFISWFDSVLAGRSCEKHISLSFKENGKLVTKSYALSYINKGFLYVDLDKPLTTSESFSPTCYPFMQDVSELSS